MPCRCGAAPLPEAAFRRLPGCRRALYGSDPDAGQHVHTRRAHRAEVSDIYNAVLDGAASVMLTGETAAGQYPMQAMEYLVRTAQTALA